MPKRIKPFKNMNLVDWMTASGTTVPELARLSGLGERTIKNARAGTNITIDVAQRLVEASRSRPADLGQHKGVVGFEEICTHRVA